LKQLLTILISTLTIPSSAHSQDKGDWLVEKLRTADTVILVSHAITAGVKIVDTSTGKDIPLPELIISDKPNYSIVKERQIMTGTQLDTLIKILSRPFEDREIEVAKCFMPHHAIFIIKNGVTSYFDICFECHQFDTSEDLKGIYAFDNRKWAALRNLFLELGFKYELGGAKE